jgi:hypothetical protein
MPALRARALKLPCALRDLDWPPRWSAECAVSTLVGNSSLPRQASHYNRTITRTWLIAVGGVSSGPCAHSLWKTLWCVGEEWRTTGGNKAARHSRGTLDSLASPVQAQFLWTLIQSLTCGYGAFLPSVHRPYDYDGSLTRKKTNQVRDEGAHTNVRGTYTQQPPAPNETAANGLSSALIRRRASRPDR